MHYEAKLPDQIPLIQYQVKKPDSNETNQIKNLNQKRRLVNSETVEVIEFTEKDLDLIYQMPQSKLSDIKNPKEFQSRIMKYGVENAHQLSGLILFNSIKSRDNFLVVYSKYNIPFKIYEDGLTIKSTSDGVIRVLDCMAAESCVFKKFYN